MKYYTKWAHHEHPLSRRLLVTFFAGLIFAVLIPTVLINFFPRLDTRMHIPLLFFGGINFVVGGSIIVIGGFYGFWSIGSQLFDAKGSPIPMLPTQKLLITGPFKQCRNPMGFGAILAYFGISILVGSLSAFICVGLFATLLIIYIKKIEERELAARFGEDYRIYKASTPFIIPRIFSHKS